MTHLSNEFLQECRHRLLMLKSELLNRVRMQQTEFAAQERFISGDEIDQTVAQLAENSFLIDQARLRKQLLEIESALGRIQNGNFGICEETQEPIETDRLLALPYTRLSIEGAEIREATDRRYAR